MGSVTMSPLLTRGLTLLLLILVAATTTGKEGCQEAKKCDTDKCSLPDCFCSGNETILEGDYNVTDKPQIVYLTFDDAFSNPNGCAIRATHFVTHSYTDYSLVNKYWHMGHEIASHSITHRNNLTYWAGMTEEEWKQEIVGQRRITGQFSAINPCEI